MGKTTRGSIGRRRHGALSLVLAAGLFFSAAFACWGLDPQKDIGQYIIDVWNTESSGLPQNSVLSLVQTRDSYLWIGTYEGLCRFDGLNFTVFDKSNTAEIQNNRMLVLAEGPDGALWIGTPNGLLCRRDGSFRNYTAADGLSGDFILSLAFDLHGCLWIGTTEGLSRYQGGAFRRIQATDEGDPSYISALCADRSGTVWVGASSGLYEYRYGRFIHRPLPGGQADNTIWSLCMTRSGTLWIGTAGDSAFIPMRKTWPAAGSGSSSRTDAAPSGSAPTTAG
jgi:ligand-binding sensor domain-containing protein